ncbi:MAG: hypothetical protein ACLP5H_34070 [Desulfomonilaceae bacterium]
MSETYKEELIRFVADLKQQTPPITWKDVAQRAQAQLPKTEGVSLTENAIRKRYNTWLRESEGSKRSNNNKDQGEEIAMSSHAKKHLPQELLEHIENYIEEYMRPVIERVSMEAAEKVFEEKFVTLLKAPVTTSDSYLPAPPMPDTVEGTRRHTVPRGKLAGTVDAALLKLFESERKERGFSVSRMLDVIIWNYFAIGRPEPPKLSFELSETARPTEED